MDGPKTCSKCGESKPLSEFNKEKSKRFGVSAWCKACKSGHSQHRNHIRRPHVLKLKREWRASNVEHRKDYAAKYNKKNRPHIRERQRHEYYTTEGRARRLLRQEVRAKRIVKPANCEDCGKPTPQKRLHGHHSDYTRPYDVEWLCPTCHGRRHRVVLEESA